MQPIPTDRWFDFKQVNQHIPKAVRPWLLDTGSLTKRLIAASDNHFRVQVLQQGWAQPALNEARLLGLNTRETSLIRETALYCRDEIWVYARSVIPVNTLSGRLRHLRSLKNSSLGALLFADPSMNRSPFQVALINAKKLPISLDLPVNTALWGRRSCFVLQQKPLLVSEIFLPNFQASNTN